MYILILNGIRRDKSICNVDIRDYFIIKTSSYLLNVCYPDPCASILTL